MALADLQGILNTLQIENANRNAQAQQASLDEYRKQQQKEAEARMQEAVKKQQDEHDYHQQILDVTKQTRKLQHQEDVQKIQRDFYSSGLIPAGAKFTQGNVDQGGTLQLPEAYNDEKGQPYNLNLEPIADRANRQAAITRQINAPVYEEAERKRNEDAAAKMEQLKANQQAILDRVKEQDETKRWVAQLHSDTMKAIGAMRNPQNPNDGSDPDTESQHALKLLAGEETKEDLKSLYAGKQAPIFTRIVNTASKSGVPIDKAQQQGLKVIQQLKSNLSILDNTIDKMHDSKNPITGSIGNFLTSISNPEYRSNIDQLKASLPATALNSTGMHGRFSLPEFNLVAGGYIPGPTTSKQEAIANRNALKKTLDKYVDNIPGIKDPQKKLIRHSLGLDAIPQTYQEHEAGTQMQSNVDAVLPPPQQGVQQ